MIDFEAVKIKISKSLILIDVKKQRYMMWNRGYNIYLVASFQGHLYKLKVTKHVEDGWYLNNIFCTSFSFGIQKMVNSFKEKKTTLSFETLLCSEFNLNWSSYIEFPDKSFFLMSFRRSATSCLDVLLVFYLFSLDISNKDRIRYIYMHIQMYRITKKYTNTTPR